MLHAGSAPADLRQLSDDTADFFCKAPDNKVLEFAMSAKVILVEGDAEFILISELYAAVTGSSLEQDRVHVISVDGTSFKRYLDVAIILGNRVAAICDNDHDYQTKCVERFVDYQADNVKVFADKDAMRWTFEVCIYQDNQAACDELFAPGRKTLSVQDYMLSNKTESALRLLKDKKDQLAAPAYLREAIEWINA
jgi:putative ATP-dependent endonuclease of OLD family